MKKPHPVDAFLIKLMAARIPYLSAAGCSVGYHGPPWFNDIDAPRSKRISASMRRCERCGKEWYWAPKNATRAARWLPRIDEHGKGES